MRQMTFRYRHAASGTHFSCRLKCTQCIANVEQRGTDGQTKSRRCKRRVCVGTNVCSKHRSEITGLTIRPSNIKGAGKGVFATRDFDMGEVLGVYTGEILDQDTVNARYGRSETAVVPYGVGVTYKNQSVVIDAACARSLLSMANGKPTMRASNAFFSDMTNFDGFVNVFAHKPIKKGTEVLINYGKDYFARGNDTIEHSTT